MWKLKTIKGTIKNIVDNRYLYIEDKKKKLILCYVTNKVIKKKFSSGAEETVKGWFREFDDQKEYFCIQKVDEKKEDLSLLTEAQKKSRKNLFDRAQFLKHEASFLIDPAKQKTKRKLVISLIKASSDFWVLETSKEKKAEQAIKLLKKIKKVEEVLEREYKKIRNISYVDSKSGKAKNLELKKGLKNKSLYDFQNKNGTILRIEKK